MLPLFQAKTFIEFENQVKIKKKPFANFIKKLDIKQKHSLYPDAMEILIDYTSIEQFNNIHPLILKEIYNIYKQFPKNIEESDTPIEQIYSEFTSLTLTVLPTEKINYVGQIVLFNSTNFESLHHINKFINCSELHIDRAVNVKRNILSIFLLKDVKVYLFYTFTDFKEKDVDWINIVTKYLGGDKDIIACQEELIEHGYKEFAKL